MNKIVRILTILSLFSVIGLKAEDVTNVLFVNDSENREISFELDGTVKTGPVDSEKQVVCKATLGLNDKIFCSHYNTSLVSPSYIDFRIQNFDPIKRGKWIEVSTERCPYLIVKVRKKYQTERVGRVLVSRHRYSQRCVIISLAKDGMVNSSGNLIINLKHFVSKYKTEIDAERIARLYNFVHNKPFYIKERKCEGYAKEDIQVLADDIKFVEMLADKNFQENFDNVIGLSVSFLYGSDHVAPGFLLEKLQEVKKQLEGIE